MTKASLVLVLAESFLAGEADVEQIAARAGRMLGRNWRWLRPLAHRYVAAIDGRTRPRRRDVVAFLLADEGFEHARVKLAGKLSVESWLAESHRMQPVAAARTWDVPAIESAGALADWLSLELGDLEWFADLKGRNGQPRLEHYHYRVLAKKSGSARLIEAPKPHLKHLQRRILARILEKVPAHPAAHGFVKGRSIRTFVELHASQRVVLRMDLRDFFVSFSGARIQALFRTMGYPESVADLLGGICTNAAPGGVWNRRDLELDPQELWQLRALYARPHLPQGAATSPALANLCSYRVDCRLMGLARAAGATYTRYADDLAFSGDEAFERRVERFAAHAAAILHEEGFAVNHRKTRIMRQSVRQHLAGLVANQGVNVRRADFDRLKATLTNCVRLGPESQNRGGHASFRAHLEGRVGFVETINAVKGKRLRAILEEIRWP